ncbi:MAG: arsenate reductase ArsC [Actinobacteria bacterium]|nr:arsenate reductase ArsC [Actinomycetota bacterium]
MSPSSETEIRHHLKVAVDRLVRAFSGTFSPETVTRYVDETLSQWSGSPVTGYIPLLLERFVRQRLTALGQAEGTIVKEVPEVLFVCVHNAGRSQMAAALLDHRAKGRVHVRSAGTLPGSKIHAPVVAVMEELGLDLTQEFPKPLTDEVVRAADVVITMGCGDACPVYPGKRYLDWELPDPEGKAIKEVRLIRDEIDRRVKALIEELVPPSP